MPTFTQPKTTRSAPAWAGRWPGGRRLAPVLVAVVLGLLTAGFVYQQTKPSAAARTVVVAARPVAAGTVLGPDDVRQAQVADGLPDTKLATGNVVGQTTTVDLAPGEVLQTRRLGRGGAAALIPSGHLALPVPKPGGVAAVRAGHRVDVLDKAGEPVATDVEVIGVDDEYLVLALPEGVVPDVARTVQERAAQVALRGTRPR